MSTIEKAIEIATAAHNGQKRWGGEPYFTYLEAVSEIVEKNLLNSLNDGYYKEYIINEYKIVAILHDIIEDTNTSEKDLEKVGFNNVVRTAVIALTKLPSEKYLDYLKRVAKNNYAIEVKIADLTHNLKDLKKGSMRDKYEMALSLLSSEEGRKFLGSI